MMEPSSNSDIIKFRKDVKKLKIPDNCNELPVDEGPTIEFIVEIE